MKLAPAPARAAGRRGPRRGLPPLTPARAAGDTSFLGERGASNEMIVKNIIGQKQIHKVITAKPHDSVKTAAELLSKNRIGAVVVSRDGEAVDGILSERDIVRALATTGPSCLELSVRDLMTPEVVGCRPDDTANSVLEKMTQGRFRHMPVVEDGRMVGVISIGDVVKARLAEIESENTALTGMIANSW